ncbi:uroporphyrinogen-III C-methyltransferase [Aliidiomarina soli]|uniref:Tetrapyrrole biosynthesis uroporphyrinogen III synthase domain-containing protein n=1 Tax=Aliidiomarina soli TaxID=1928574 RepID=A0A432WF41_9GAMM|nr:uroporphyrinogen-III C-methyltransferase [Aliidiomarina soli]RUO32327.1 hypothetical protein CWE14_09245 [Aliidiomarina soli]
MTTGVLLIRPHDQANALEQTLSSEGYQVFRHAVIETQQITLSDEVLAQLADTYDGIVVVSPTAVGFLDQQLSGHKLTWPKGRYYCVGSGTAERLVAATHQAVTYPAPEHTGESLLALDELGKLDHQHWLFVTGKDGRTLIADTLRQRGASVETLEVYQRSPLHPNISTKLPEWQQQVDIAVVTSVQQLDLFFADLIDDGLQWARSINWVVSSQRLHDALTQQGVKTTHVHKAQNATTNALVTTIQDLQTKETKTVTSQSSDRTEHSAKPTEPAPRSRFYLLFSLILLVCVVILAGGNYWVWTQQQSYRAQTNAQLQTLNERIESSARAQERLEGDLFRGLQSSLDERMSRLQQEREREANQRREEQAEERQAMHDEFSQQRNELERLQEDLDSSGMRMSQDLYLVEARDLVMAAGRTLWLDMDRPTAIRLLQRADELLRDADERSLIPLRQQLQADIDLLDNIEEPNLEELAIRLSSMRRQIHDLPFNQQQSQLDQPAETNNDISGDFSEWRNNLAKAWDSFTDDFIRVQRTDELPAMQLGHEQRSLLVSQLQLQLQLAQQALMQRQTVNYREALRQTADWIERYFDIESQRVQELATELRQLSEHDLEPDYPTRLLSEAMLKDAVDDRLEGAN